MSSGGLYFVFICIERLSQIWVYLLLAIVIAVVYLISEETSRRQNSSTYNENSGKTVLNHSDVAKTNWQLPNAIGGGITNLHKTRSKSDVLLSGSSAVSLSTSSAGFPQFQPLRTSTSITVINFPSGRNLLNKKEPPNTIKEASESTATLDDQDADKASKTLSHENTVVRVDTSNTKQQQTPQQLHQQKAAAINDTLSTPQASSLSAASTILSSPRRTAAAVMKKPITVNSAIISQKKEIVCVTQQLLDSISCRDYTTYSNLCDAGMTCFEPESMGNLIEGMDFHKFYFTYAANDRITKIHTTMLNPSVHLIGDDGACIAYIRLTQYIDRNGEARSRQSEETRVWQKQNGRGWVCVHVHRSGAPSSVNTACQD